MEEPLFEFFKTFAEAQRLRMAGLLLEETLTVEEIAARLKMRAVDVPRHLAMFERMGLLIRAEERVRLDPRAIEAVARQVLSARREAPAQAAHEDADDFDRSVVRNFVMPDGRLRELPSAAKKRQALLRHVAQVFEPGVRYTEKEVNEKLARVYSDHASLRRYLYDDGLLQREANGSAYWREEKAA